MTVCVLGLARSLSAASAPGSTAATAARPLTAAAFHAISPEQLSARTLIRIKGVVTYTVAQPSLIFVQDDTGGVCCSGPRDPTVRRQVRPGALVEVTGIATQGRSGPYLSAAGKEALNISVIQTSRPPPPKSVALAGLSELRTHSELVETGGIVRQVRIETLGPQQEALVVTLFDQGVRTEAVCLNWNSSLTPPAWVGSDVRLRGIFNPSLPDRQQSATGRLLFSSLKEATVAAAAKPDIEVPTSRIAEARESPEAARLEVQGVVTLKVAERGAYVQDVTGGMWVQNTSQPLPAEGQAVRALGFAAIRDGNPILEDSQFTSLGAAPLPPARTVTVDEALSGAVDACRVQIDALVLQVSRLAEGSTVVLQAGERVFLARLATPNDQTPSITAPANSWVRVSGVCVNNRPPGTSNPQARPVSFHIMLPTADAVSVIRTPGWWTLEKVLVVTGILVVAALLALVWVLLLRRRVTLQTAQIRRHLHQETVNEERMRIARELHDSLEQDLLGITLQLKATDKLLDRPTKAREALALASAMVRRSQAETHRAVWDLRERRDGEGLVATLRSALAGLTRNAKAGGPAVKVEVSGQEQELHPQTENHLLRIALESVTNAFKHAQAKNVVVRLEFDKGKVLLQVQDDGAGFDADHPPLPISGHFGLFGMKERAGKLGGQLVVRSVAGSGTCIRLIAPTDQDEARQPPDPISAARASREAAAAEKGQALHTPVRQPPPGQSEATVILPVPTSPSAPPRPASSSPGVASAQARPSNPAARNEPSRTSTKGVAP